MGQKFTQKFFKCSEFSSDLSVDEQREQVTEGESSANFSFGQDLFDQLESVVPSLAPRRALMTVEGLLGEDLLLESEKKKKG